MRFAIGRHLDGEADVVGVSGVGAQAFDLVAVTPPDGTGIAVPEGHLQVASVGAEGADVGEADAAGGEDGLGIPFAERRHLLDAFDNRKRQVGGLDPGVDRLIAGGGRKNASLERAGGGKGAAEGVEAAFLHREAAGGGMSAVVEKQRGAGNEGVPDVVAVRGAGRTASADDDTDRYGALPAVSCKSFEDTGGHDTRDAGMSVRQVNDLRRSAGDDLGKRLVGHRLLDVLALDIGLVNRPRELTRRLAVVGQHQPQGVHAAAHPAGGVDARTDQEAEVACAKGRRDEARRAVQEFAQTDRRGLAKEAERRDDEDAVLAAERHDVRHGRESRQDQKRRREAAARIESLGLGAVDEGLRDQKGDACPAESLQFRGGGDLRIDDGTVRQLGTGQVMVGHDDGNAAFLQFGDLLDSVDAVVDGHHEADVGLFGKEPGERRPAHPVSLGQALGQERHDGRLQRLKCPDENGGGADAVAVVVAEDDDLAPDADGGEDGLDRRADAGQPLGAGQVAERRGEIRLDRLRRHLTQGEKTRQQTWITRVCQRVDRRGVDRFLKPLGQARPFRPSPRGTSRACPRSRRTGCPGRSGRA